MKNLVERFNSVHAVKRSLEKEIEDTENTITEYSNLLGKKLELMRKHYQMILSF